MNEILKKWESVVLGGGSLEPSLAPLMAQPVTREQ